jgi:hypothetical protein
MIFFLENIKYIYKKTTNLILKRYYIILFYNLSPFLSYTLMFHVIKCEISGRHDFALTFKREFLNLEMTNLS